MTIKYKIEQVKPNIFAVIIGDSYDLAMTFCRVQEFYESPNDEFRDKNFSIWDYMKWYTKQNSLGFTYANDWAGFNIPFDVLEQCYVDINQFETPYDKLMFQIYSEIKKMKSEESAYVLGISKKDSTLDHEICHALWHINQEYKNLAEDILSAIEPDHIQIFENNLLEMGYTHKVLKDEIQAYLTTSWNIGKFYKGMTRDDCQIYHLEFKKILTPFLLKSEEI